MQAISRLAVVARYILHEYRDSSGPLPRLWRDFDISDDQVFLGDKVSQQAARHAHNRLQSLAPPKYGDAKVVVQEDCIQTNNLIPENRAASGKMFTYG